MLECPSMGKGGGHKRRGYDEYTIHLYSWSIQDSFAFLEQYWECFAGQWKMKLDRVDRKKVCFLQNLKYQRVFSPSSVIHITQLVLFLSQLVNLVLCNEIKLHYRMVMRFLLQLVQLVASLPWFAFAQIDSGSTARAGSSKFMNDIEEGSDFGFFVSSGCGNHFT